MLPPRQRVKAAGWRQIVDRPPARRQPSGHWSEAAGRLARARLL